jgi:hypothetical protein
VTQCVSVYSATSIFCCKLYNPLYSPESPDGPAVSVRRGDARAQWAVHRAYLFCANKSVNKKQDRVYNKSKRLKYMLYTRNSDERTRTAAGVFGAAL